MTVRGHPLKSFFDERVVRGLARDLRSAHRSFDARELTRISLDGLDALELTARGRHVAEALRTTLPQPFARAADVLVASLSDPLEQTMGFGMAPFRYMPHVFFVAKYGLDDFEASMRAQYELTQRFTAESSIRPFLVK